jgi:hypothetical protein
VPHLLLFIGVVIIVVVIVVIIFIIIIIIIIEIKDQRIKNCVSYLPRLSQHWPQLHRHRHRDRHRHRERDRHKTQTQTSIYQTQAYNKHALCVHRHQCVYAVCLNLTYTLDFF